LFTDKTIILLSRTKKRVSLAIFASLREAQAFCLARSFHSLKPLRSQRKTRIGVQNTAILPHYKQRHLTAEVAEIEEEDKNRVKNKGILLVKRRHLTVEVAEDTEKSMFFVYRQNPNT